MNRTTLFLGLAAVLTLLAVVVGLPTLNTTRTITVTAPPVDPVDATDPVDPKPTPPLRGAQKDGALSLQARLSHPYVGAGRSDVFLTLDVVGKELPGAERSPVNLALVLDRSGSMSGQKLSDAKRAARHLVNQLRDGDRLAIIHYGSDVRAFPSTQATATHRERMLRYIDNIFDEGGTNIGDGLSSGRDQLLPHLEAFKVNRVILISDGQPTEGLTSHTGLVNVVRQIRSHGVSVSSIGVGTDFNEDLMQAFAEVGAGSYGYLQDTSRLASIFQKDLLNASTQIAREVTLELKLPEGAELGEVLGYNAVQSGRTVRITLPDFASGQLERVVTRVVVSGDAVGRTVDVANVGLSYRDLVQNTDAGTQVRLAAMVTDREEEIAKHQDKAAVVYATRAQSARNTFEAAESLKKGDRSRALQLLRQNHEMFQQAASVAGAPAVAADMAEQKAMLQEVEAARTEEQVNHQIKAGKRKAMKDYGRLGSTY